VTTAAEADGAETHAGSREVAEVWRYRDDAVIMAIR
jgi:hypothetical protein